ncbi:MAG: patatin-like phospholipase family protein [Patescibacteria group bacterium]
MASRAKKVSGRKTVGLALGGGGARGLAHVGVIRALRRAGIPIDYIAGTSMGALVGAFYAATQDTEALEAAFLRLDRRDVMPIGRILAKKDGVLFRDPEIAEFLDKAFDERRIESCAVPFAAVATDVKTGEAVVLKNGSLAGAVRASIALPIIFPPVAREKRLLMDGGFSNPVPADVVRAMGADVVIAVDVTSRWVNIADELVSVKNLYGIVSNALSVVEYQISRQILKTADLVLRPPVLQYGWLSFDMAPRLITAGDEEVGMNIEKICRAAGVKRPNETALDKFFAFLRSGT